VTGSHRMLSLVIPMCRQLIWKRRGGVRHGRPRQPILTELVERLEHSLGVLGIVSAIDEAPRETAHGRLILFVAVAVASAAARTLGGRNNKGVA